jgi:hypothetical protein
MQKINNIILNAAAILIAVMVSVGCLEKEEIAADVQSVMIELSVSTEEQTKATPTASENTINSLHIYAFYGERLAGYISRGAITQGDPFYMDLELPETGIHEVEFYVIANVAQMAYESGMVTLSENMNKSQLEAIKFTSLTSGETLPMYCKQKEEIDVNAVSSVSNATDGHEGHVILTKKVNFDLSRSLAKISLYAAKVKGTASTPQILNVKILAAGIRAYSYLFPQSEQALNDVASRPNDRTILSSAVNVNAEVDKGDKEAANYDRIIADEYLPEVTYGSEDWSVSSGNEREVVLRVEYALSAEGEVRTGFIYMPPIVRNTHYKVCVLISSEGQIIVNYEVLEWEDNIMYDIQFDYPTHSYLRESIPVTEADINVKPGQPAQMSEAKPFEGYFQMTYPSNDSWTPTLMGPQSGNCTITVYEMDGYVPTEISEDKWPISASDKWYKIVVTPNPVKVSFSDEVKLAVTYKAAGFETMEYMLINGSYQEYYWPYAGESTQDANYVIITMVN